MDFEFLERILDGREKPTNLSFALLKHITENFSDDREIGHGGFATVYKGVLPNESVAVKRIRNVYTINETFFYREVDSLLNIEHKNVVRFLGFCASTDQIAIPIGGSKEHIYAEVRERLLCFEYISNGSLKRYITDELRGLEWNTRYEIIRGICEGLHHLHKEKQIYHMDLKPENILLDKDMVPKITDFGLSRLDEKSKTMSEDRHGSLGYCAPEYLHRGKMSFKSDMYSLGVIIIELLTGEKAIHNNNNNVLRRWRHRWKKTGKETPLVYEQVAKCVEIGLLCLEIDPSKRPFIWDIIHAIREMEGVNGTISNDSEYTFGQLNPYSKDDMLGIEPLDLHFPFQLNKKSSCTFQLTNETDSYIAFNVEHMNPLSYCALPQKGIIPPRSKCNVEITMEPQGKALRDRTSEFTVWSTKVNDGLAIEDITTSMFIQEATNVVDEVNLDVVFDASEACMVAGRTPDVKPRITDGCEKLKNWKLVDIFDPGHLQARHCPDSATYPTKVVRLLYTNDGTALLSLGSDGVHKLWKWQRSDRNHKLKSTASVSPHLWQPESGLVMVNYASDGIPKEATACIVVSKNDFYVVSASGGEISLYSMRTFKVMATFMAPPPAATFLAFYPHDYNIIAIGLEDSTIQIYDIRSDEVKSKLKGHQKKITGLAFSLSMNVLVSSGADAQLCIWSIDGWDKKKSKYIQPPANHSRALVGDTSVQFHNDQTHLLVVQQSQLSIYDENLECLRSWNPRDALPAPVSSAIYSCDGLLVYAGFCDGAIGVFEAGSLRLRCRIVLSAYVPSSISSGGSVYPMVVAAHPLEPNQIAVGMSDGEVHVLEPLKADRKWGVAHPQDNGAHPNFGDLFDDFFLEDFFQEV
ncbi:hypothetical protein CFC21_105814 [Triticum aestivum]|uniref:Protein kinase domain-containing protein n=3 Tax=Triticum aestivum TaxID=4565 RepID=A0A9R1N8W5_WHEAT|nr:uncharacterized protein LOC123156356 isoform X1 [Triticum aestivum]XP_044430425.1 uncharacterized protein LOC123156356 isoform X1 [Triticum aestivum]XP_044430426.1 uncharacterized protein LOC123156356 isoform X1 [Triticum aestivum]XP_044430427.1 uncharacterized protein LOC123156356 isoform X1 [Triticum aestivum]XP_044430428.1 uncharacterized protein LOC123156356 isoform X1 [Triticum aestivum]KAF7104952.1 hypothetical protein CFC21_105814 [Triticum aestivum]